MKRISGKGLVAGIIVLFVTQYIASLFIDREPITWGIGVIAMVVVYNYIKYGRFGRYDTVR
jgi:4-hydroxybenzoate polyprenyltransferase